MTAQPSPAKWHRLRSLSDDEGRFNMLAIDQRGRIQLRARQRVRPSGPALVPAASVEFGPVGYGCLIAVLVEVAEPGTEQPMDQNEGKHAGDQQKREVPAGTVNDHAEGCARRRGVIGVCRGHE